MRAFACPSCANLIFFENSICLSCRSGIGYVRAQREFVALARDNDGAYFDDDAGRTLRPCANKRIAACNWLADAEAPQGLCDCCLLTRTRAADNDAPGMSGFLRAETAKRRLLFQLDELGLPVVPRTTDPEHGLAFDLLSSTHTVVTTGHASGVITIDLAEGDDGHREALRVQLDEPYRTMLGHFRHEIGHWYWDVLLAGGPDLEHFRALFGDERTDYSRALKRHYQGEHPPQWRRSHVSSYATAHPWEDWAETFAHYLHIRDSVQTAAAFGISVHGPSIPVREHPHAPTRAEPAEGLTDFGELIDTWLPLTLALNAVNRSMGKDDLYPFVLSTRVVEKLRFVHRIVTSPLPVAP
jgi:hypothetical protein